MNHEPSQFCGPPTRRGRHPQCAPPPIGHAIRHVCEWTHCVWMSGLSAEEPGSSPPTRRPDGAPSSPPGGRGPESGCACRVCERMDGWVVCAWLRAWLGVCKAGWERMQRREKDTNTSEEKQKLRNATMRLAKISGKKFCLWKRLILQSLKERTLDMWKK